ncbi:MAG: aminoacetone oxidase family FAD-binding enzyme [Clostridia bacterium]|nr:aminoacetone oxidase family FAD-binding enzyme [Clostridia bacterium]
MEKVFDVCIIGGGASGLVCAIKCAGHGKNVCIVEKSAKLGKKLLVTGNGRCNLSNEKIIGSFYNNQIVDKVFSIFSQVDTIKFFKSIGIETFADEEGRIYPISKTASSVVDALILKIESLNIKVFCGEEVLNVHKEKNLFEIKTQNNLISSKNIVVACGAKSAQQIFAKSGHKFLQQKNVLVGLECEKPFDKNLAGTKINCEVSCNIGKENFKEFGQVLFKEKGISGIVIFNLSAFVAKYGNFPVDISLNLLPKLGKEKLNNILLERKVNCSYLKIENILLGLLPYKLNKNLMKKIKINDFNIKINKINEKIINNLINNIFDYKLTAINTLGEPQVLSGGFDLSEFDNLQSKKIKGLFACGEASGVFGFCGGYNLQYAWSSGVFVSNQIAGEK